MINARTIFLAAIMHAFAVSPAYTQYMYLDSNGNGISDAGDVLNENGTVTTVEAYLYTNQDRVGTVRTCNDGFSGQGIRLVSYSVNLVASGGTVTYGAPTSASPFTGAIANVNPGNGVSLLVSYGDPSGTGLEEGGPYLLFTVSATGDSGSPKIDIATGAPVDGANLTYFATPCFGAYTFDTIWYLTMDVALLDGEWTDVDGIAAAPLSISAPASVSTEEGAAVEIQSSATGSGAGGPPTITAEGFPATLSVDVVATGENTSEATLSGELGANDAGIYTIV